MRKTHLESFKSCAPVWPLFEDAFRICSEIDRNDKWPIAEMQAKAVYDQFILPQRQSLLRPLFEQRRNVDLTIFLQLYHAWKDQNFCDISPSLCKKLMETEFRDVDTFFIKIPTRSMYLSFPKGNGLYVPSDGKLHELLGVYIIYVENEDKSTVFLGENSVPVPGVNKFVNILAVGEEHEVYDDALLYFHLLFWDGKVSESVRRSKECVKFEGDLWQYSKNIFEVVSKILLYMNCSNRVLNEVAGVDLTKQLDRLKNPAKKRKLLKRYDRLSTKPHQLLDLVVNKSQPSTHSSSSGIGLKKSPEVVSPHFKVQRFGKNYSQSKIMHIDEYVRGDVPDSMKQEFKKKKRKLTY